MSVTLDSQGMERHVANLPVAYYAVLLASSTIDVVGTLLHSTNSALIGIRTLRTGLGNPYPSDGESEFGDYLAFAMYIKVPFRLSLAGELLRTTRSICNALFAPSTRSRS